MGLQSVGHRFVVWGNRNPFTMAIIFDLIIIIVFAVALQRQNDASIARARSQVVAESKARDAQIAASQLEVCKRAVIAVTNQGKEDDLKLVKGIEDRFTEGGKPVPTVYLNLELLIANRQPPTAACEP